MQCYQGIITLELKSEEEKENVMGLEKQKKLIDENVTDNTVKKPTGLKAMRTLSAEVKNKNIAPMLADWNRSQSFPIPGKSCMQNVIGIEGNFLRDENGFGPDQSPDETGIFKEGLPRKISLPRTASNASVNQDGKLFLIGYNYEITNTSFRRCPPNIIIKDIEILHFVF